MLTSCPGCGRQLSFGNHFQGVGIRCTGCNTLVQHPSTSQAADHPYPTQSYAYGNASISNQALILTAMACVAGLLLAVLAMAVLFHFLTPRPTPTNVPVAAAEAEDDALNRVDFREGYSITLPPGFRQQSREETERGYIVYRFRSQDGYAFTLAVLPDESEDIFKRPPATLSSALVKGVEELSEGVEGELLPTRVNVDGMRASMFQYYETETYRGVTFTYFMVAVDEHKEKRLALKFAGKYGRFDEDDDNISMPVHWYDSLLTLRRRYDSVAKQGAQPRPLTSATGT